MIVAPITHLLLLSGPAAVTWLIVAVLVWITVERMFSGWFASHVGQEVGEGIPARADRDAAATVEAKMFVRRIGAALAHFRPTMILRNPMAIPGVAMFRRTADGVIIEFSHVRTPVTDLARMAARVQPRPLFAL